MKTWKKRTLFLTTVFVGLGILGILVVASGIIPISASSGHLPITEWFLHFSMKRSISTHSMGIKPPDLDDRGRILRGGGSYLTNCFSCHGAPGFRYPVIPAMMTPHPPYLPDRVGEWTDAQLFTLVKHGVKFTGMPAWPALVRDDEVWDMVAFVRTLPKMDRQGFQNATGETPDLAVAGMDLVTGNCFRCHGQDGLGRDGAFPILAGQKLEYLTEQLKAYREGTRPSGSMQPVSQYLTDEQISDLATYFSKLPRPGVPEAPANPGIIELGRRIAHEGVPSRKVASCIDCHSLDGSETRAEYPLLDGQPFWYLVRQLELFHREVRGGSDAAHLMNAVAPRLTDDEIEAVAAYYSSQSGPPGSE